MKHRIASLALLTAIVLAVGACQSGGSLGTVPPVEPTPEPSLGSTPPDVTPGPTSSPAPATPTPTSSGAPGSPSPSAPPQGTSVLRAYFVLGGEPGSEGLVPTLFEVPETNAVATAAMNHLLAGPPTSREGYAPISTAIPAGTKLLGLTIRGGVATVDLSGEFASGGGSASAMYRLAQVVYTLTQFGTVTSVVFHVDGEPVTVFGSEGIVLDGPVGRDRFEHQLPAVFVDRPAYGAQLNNTGKISGTANVFEATFRVTILDGAGRVVADKQVMATCGTGCRGTFETEIGYNVAKAQWGTLRAWVGSAVDGSPQDVREYPVWLVPAK
jgi:hypothetical protein